MDRFEAESARSPEQLNRDIENVLLSCERAGEGGKAVVLKLSPNGISPELHPALEALNVDNDEARAVKLLKLYLPNKGAFEYKMHGQAYQSFQDIPESDQNSYARIPALSSSRDVDFDNETKAEIERRFRASIVGDKAQLIVMEYVDGEDLATIFYKWILENERRYASEQTDQMDFKELYEEVAKTLNFEMLPDGEIDDPRALELAEWKTSSRNTAKLYDYLHKNHFPLSPEIVSQLEKTLTLLHAKAHITHGDAFERNVMIQGGTQVFRENQPDQRKQSYLIDFGEARDHEVEGVDDFAIIRRLKKLLASPKEETEMNRKKIYDEINAKANRLSTNRQWQETYSLIKKLLSENPDKALATAWSRTAGQGENSIDAFFITMKRLANENLLDAEIVASFIAEKKKTLSSPFQRNRTEECLRWFEL
jgi:hypothetical protein